MDVKFFLKPVDIVTSPRQGIKIYLSYFWWVVSLRLVVMSNKCFLMRYVWQWWLASSGHNQLQRHRILANRYATLLVAEWKRVLPVQVVKAEVVEFLFRAALFFLPVQGIPGTATSFNLFHSIFISFISFFFSNPNIHPHPDSGAI